MHKLICAVHRTPLAADVSASHGVLHKPSPDRYWIKPPAALVRLPLLQILADHAVERIAFVRVAANGARAAHEIGKHRRAVAAEMILPAVFTPELHDVLARLADVAVAHYRSTSSAQRNVRYSPASSFLWLQ